MCACVRARVCVCVCVGGGGSVGEGGGRWREYVRDSYFIGDSVCERESML